MKWLLGPLVVLSFTFGFLLGVYQTMTGAIMLSYFPAVIAFFASDPVDITFIYALSRE